MRRRLSSVALVVLASMTAAVAYQSAQGAQTEALLRIDAVVTDRKGMPVADVRPEELELWLGGLRIPIEAVDAPVASDTPRARRWITLVIDDITMPPIGLARGKEVARRILAGLGPGDRAAVVQLSGGAATVTDDRAALLRRIESINLPTVGFTHPADFGAQVLGTFEDVARAVAEAPARRRTIVGIGSAWAFDRPIPPFNAGRELRPEWTAALRALAASNVTVYVVDPAGVGGAPAYNGDAGLARDTGGFAIVNTNDLDAVAERILAEISTYYTIEVKDPPHMKGAALRDVEVKVKRPNLKARARRLILGRS